jgi:hypothetical protein
MSVLPVNEKGLALHEMGAAVGLRALNAMSLELERHRGDAGDVPFDLPRPILAASGRDTDQVGKMNAIVNRTLRQV